MSEIDIKNVEVDGVAIGDTGIYAYNEYQIIPYDFNGVILVSLKQKVAL